MNRLPTTSCTPPGAARPAGLALLLIASTFTAAHAQNWDASPAFRYNILDAKVTLNGSSRTVTVVFSVTDPVHGNQPWNLKTDVPFTLAGARLSVDVGWNTREYHNAGAAGENVVSVPFGKGTPAAAPISLNALTTAVPAPSGVAGQYQVVASLPGQAFGTGVVAIEGHPMWPDATGVPVAVPVKSVYRYVPISDPQAVPRRQIVDFAKCQVCHSGNWNDEIQQVIPRLTLHGSNRTEEPGVCVICHNPDQTDIGYRTAGAEVPVDFKTMIHGIHGNKRRQTPLSVVGFRGTVVDFGDVEFPANPRDCFRCHIDQNGKGTYELPLTAGVRGTTINTRSTPGVAVDLDPANNLRITPTAAVCSSCHDSEKARLHMTSSKSGGAFGVLQSQIDSLAVVEKCASCHGPGKEKSVRTVHR